MSLRLKHALCVWSLVLWGGSALLAQPKVSPANWGERGLAVVPMVGAGTFEDPKRPLGMPKPGEHSRDGSGVISYRYEVSDDGQSALVEVVTRDRGELGKVLESIRTRGGTNARVFEKGRATKGEIEAEFRGRKKDFDLERFVSGAQRAPAAGTPAPVRP
ncbi:MAG: hypothetical protein R2762_28825 [Bryobacteraceae bacterium]